MPKTKGPRISTSIRPRDSPLVDVTSTVNQLQNKTSTLTEEAQALRYHALLAEARADTNKAVEHQPQQAAGPKRRRSERGEGYTPSHRMELVEIFRHFNKRTDMK
ncbi:hypothetical protein BGX23_005104, partial [Mortierella sp. AD031]